MMMNTTLAQLRNLKLDGLAAGLEEQLAQPTMAAMSFEERLALLVDREVHNHGSQKMDKRATQTTIPEDKAMAALATQHRG